MCCSLFQSVAVGCSLFQSIRCVAVCDDWMCCSLWWLDVLHLVDNSMFCTLFQSVAVYCSHELYLWMYERVTNSAHEWFLGPKWLIGCPAPAWSSDKVGYSPPKKERKKWARWHIQSRLIPLSHELCLWSNAELTMFPHIETRIPYLFRRSKDLSIRHELYWLKRIRHNAEDRMFLEKIWHFGFQVGPWVTLCFIVCNMKLQVVNPWFLVTKHLFVCLVHSL